jgi:hypothetical protein
MAQLTDLYIKLDKLKTLVSTLEKKGEKGISLTIGINDEANDYGQNVSASVSQSKEDREAGKPKFWVGKGKTFWSNNGEFKPERVDKQAAQAPEASKEGDETDELPF